jgi:hypothetical protein
MTGLKVIKTSAFDATRANELCYIGYIGTVTEANVKSMKPRLYCDSTYLIYIDKAYDKEAGEPIDTPLKDVPSESYQLHNLL